MTSTPWTPDTLVATYDEVRAYTESLAAPLSPEDQTVQSMADVSPTKWHRAHVTWFFETFVLADHEPEFAPFQDKYWFLFNSYYEARRPALRRPERGVISRPGAHDVGVYRGNVDDRMRDLVTTPRRRHARQAGRHHRARLPPRAAAPGAAADGHQARALAQPAAARLRRRADRAVAEPDALGWVDVEGGLVEIGHERRRASPSTTSSRGTSVASSRSGSPTGSSPTASGWSSWPTAATARHELWLSDGWATRQGRGLAGAALLDRGRRRLVRAHPARHLAGQPRPAGQPRQLLRGRGLRHLGRQAAADARPSGSTPSGQRGRSGRRQPRRHRRRCHPRAAGPATGRLRQVFGDCWEWTSSAYHPYPGFHPPAGAIGEYNGKFMSNQMVLRGGCALTPPGHARATYRNFFPHRCPLGALRRPARRRRRPAARSDA